MRCGVYVRVSTDDQRDNGYSIDSQLRMIKEYCEKNNYDIVDVYNDAGHSGKDLMRPEMQRLLKDIKSHKIEVIVAIKVDRLTRNNYDVFWLLNYCEEHDVKIELILEPYDVSTANGEMIFGMNLVFGQRERKEIGARTKRAMEEMALEKVHPAKAPYGYIRNVETINNKNDAIKKEIENLNKKKQRIDPNNDYKEYTIELLKKLDCDIGSDEVVFQNRLGFAFIFDSLNRKSKKELIRRLIDTIEIKRDKNYNIEITNIKFTEEFISKSSKDYIEYLYEILRNNNIGFIYKEAISKQELEKLQEDYFVFSNNKIANNEYDNATLAIYNELLKQNFYDNGIINCPYIENENIVDYLTLIPIIPSEIA